jgi:small redox-active disulfide protein 2
MAYDIKQIRIGKHEFGIVGLTDAMDAVARENNKAADSVIAEALLQKLSKDNYIPSNVKEDYKKAFLREYQKHLGLAITVQEPTEDKLIIKVVGAGCNRCDKLEMDVMGALSKLKLPAQVEHIRDLKEIAKMGIMGTPALIINGKVKCVGTVPPESQLIEWIKSSMQPGD